LTVQWFGVEEKQALFIADGKYTGVDGFAPFDVVDHPFEFELLDLA